MTEKNISTENLLRTSLHSWHTANGGKMVDFGGWEMPVQYENGILKEHLGTRRYGGYLMSVTWDASVFGARTQLLSFSMCLATMPNLWNHGRHSTP